MAGAAALRASTIDWKPNTHVETAVACAVAGVLGLAVSRFVVSPSRSHALVLGAVLVPLVAIAVGNIQRCLLALILFDIPFQWDVMLGYRPDAASIGALGGLSVSVTTLSLVLLYGGWLIQYLLRPNEAALPRLRVSVPLLAYLALSAISVLTADDRVLAGFGLALLVQSFFVYLYITTHVRTIGDVRFVVAVLVLALLAEGVILLGTRYGLSFPFVKAPVDPAVGFGGGRLGGTVGSPNTAASVLAGLLPIALALLLTPIQKRLKVCAAAAFGLGSVGLVLTGSRGGWISLGVSVAVFLAVAIRRGWIGWRHVLLATVGATLVLLPFWSLAADRLTGDDRGSARSRLPLNELAVQLIKQEPLTGMGVNNVGVQIQRTAGPKYSEEWLYTVHNKYLLVAAEAGIGALAAFLWFVASTLRRGQRAASTAHRLVAPLAAGITAALLGQLVHMTVDIFQSRPQVQLFWLAAGLLVAMKDVPCLER